MPIFDKAVSSQGNAYRNGPDLIGSDMPLPLENDTAAGYLFLSSTNKNLAAVIRYNNPQETPGAARRGRTSTRAEDSPGGGDCRPVLRGLHLHQGLGLYDQFAL
jgi:hypothetical protein